MFCPKGRQGEVGRKEDNIKCREVMVMDLDSVPDDILLRIFAFLPAEVLVGQVRAVCRRWRSLALEPALWRWRSVTYTISTQDDLNTLFRRYEAKRPIDRVIRLAPCLASLDISNVICCPVGKHISCAVSQLVCTESESQREALGNQLKLQQVKQVTIVISAFSSFRLTLDLIQDLMHPLDEVVFVPSFTTMGSRMSWPHQNDLSSKPVSGVPVKRLVVHSIIAGTTPYAHHLISRCAGALESFRVTNFLSYMQQTLPSPKLCAVLAGCPRLQHASVTLSPQLGKLLRCPALTSVELLMSDESSAQLTGSALQFLRDATRIRRLELTWVRQSRCCSSDFVLTLVSQMAPTLEHLSLSAVPHGVSLLELLQDILGRQPALRSLELPLPPKELPAFLSRLPSVVPRLRLLKLTLREREVTWEELQRCVQSLPKHMHVMARGPYTTVAWSRGLGVFNHNPGRPCPWHEPGAEWRHLKYL